MENKNKRISERIEPYFTEREEERLYNLVRNDEPEVREQRLERIANRFLQELNFYVIKIRGIKQ